jgi:hypothetical protein
MITALIKRFAIRVEHDEVAPYVERTSVALEALLDGRITTRAYRDRVVLFRTTGFLWWRKEQVMTCWRYTDKFGSMWGVMPLIVAGLLNPANPRRMKAVESELDRCRDEWSKHFEVLRPYQETH